MNKFILSISSVIFLSYWMFTVFFNLPSNPIQIQFAKENKIFQNIFFQRWSFFAPPPKSNDKLYYFFRSKSNINKVIIFEALGAITFRKREAAPFNTPEEMQDYIISGSVSEISAHLFEYTNMLKVKKDSLDEHSRILLAINNAWEHREQLNSIGTLIKYGRIVATKHNVDLDESEMKIVITTKAIPKFKDREKLNPLTSENKLFETPYFLAQL